MHCRLLKLLGWALVVGFAVVLTHDLLHGRMGAWLPPFLSGWGLLGPPLLLISSLKLLIELMRALWPPKSSEASGPPLTPPIVVACVRILGLALLAVPFVVLVHTNLTRAPGVRPGNEGEGLGLFILFTLFAPAGLAVLLLSFCFKTRKSEPREGNEGEHQR